MSLNYNGNPNLYKAGAAHEYTQEQVEEYIKCMHDPVYFARTYFKIVHVIEGLIPFALYDFQEEAIRRFYQGEDLILATSRQVGKTSLATVIILHTALFNKNKTIALLSNKEESSKEILSRIQLAYEWLPGWLKGGVVEWNKKSVEFENGSKIITSASRGDAIRGKSIFLLYVDEMAFIDNWDEFAASVLPTIGSYKGTRMIFTSTPNGLNHFYYYYKNAKEKKSEFRLIEVKWWQVPGRDEEWKNKALENLNYDQQRFDQEYCVEFQGSSGTLISGSCLKSLTPATPISETPDFKIYENPIQKHVYAITCDVSHGKGFDYSTFHVVDITELPYRQVATYRCNTILSVDFAPLVYNTAIAYNNAYILIELNDLGQQVADIIFYEYEYDNLLGSASNGRAGMVAVSAYKQSSYKGVRTTKTTKAVGCAMLKMIVEGNKLNILDRETIHELNTFSKKGSSYEAETGKHDDLVMPLVIFGWLFDQTYFKDLLNTETTKSLREKTDEDISLYLLPVGFVDRGRIDFDVEDDFTLFHK